MAGCSSGSWSSSHDDELGSSNAKVIFSLCKKYNGYFITCLFAFKVGID